MPCCPSLQNCPFFNEKLRNMPAIAEIAKDHYCRNGTQDSCARYMVAAVHGCEGVPDDLFPDQRDRAMTILGAHKDAKVP